MTAEKDFQTAVDQRVNSVINLALLQRPWRPSTVALALLGLMLAGRMVLDLSVVWWKALGGVLLGLVFIAYCAFKEARP